MLFRLLIAALAVLAACRLAAAEPLVLEVKVAAVVEDELLAGRRQLRLALTSPSAEAFAKFSAENVGRIIDFRIDGDVVASPRLVEPIPGGFLVLGGEFKPGEVEQIEDRLLDGTATLEVEARTD